MSYGNFSAYNLWILIADEVGLGKTIEVGMTIKAQGRNKCVGIQTIS